MGIDFVSPDVFKYGSLSKGRSKKERQTPKPKYKSLPKELRNSVIEAVPAVDTDTCRVGVYVPHCPAPNCGHVGGRYVSPRSARLALWGHYRWVHKWLA